MIIHHKTLRPSILVSPNPSDIYEPYCCWNQHSHSAWIEAMPSAPVWPGSPSWWCWRWCYSLRPPKWAASDRTSPVWAAKPFSSASSPAQSLTTLGSTSECRPFQCPKYCLLFSRFGVYIPKFMREIIEDSTTGGTARPKRKSPHNTYKWANMIGFFLFLGPWHLVLFDDF